MDLHCLSLKLLKHFSRRHKQTIFDVIGALGLICSFSYFGSQVILTKLFL